MSPRRRKAEDTDVFAAMVRVMLRVGPAELTLGAIAAEAGVTAGVLGRLHRAELMARSLVPTGEDRAMAADPVRLFRAAGTATACR